MDISFDQACGLVENAVRGVMARCDTWHHECLVGAVVWRSRNVIGSLGESEVLDVVIAMQKSGAIKGSTYLYLSKR